MQDQRDGFGPKVAGQVRCDLLHHRGGLRRMGEIFANGDKLAAILIEGVDIGEGAPDVDADAQIHATVFCARSRAVASASTASSDVSTTP